jgi:hypothetical protein
VSLGTPGPRVPDAGLHRLCPGLAQWGSLSGFPAFPISVNSPLSSNSYSRTRARKLAGTLTNERYGSSQGMNTFART